MSGPIIDVGLVTGADHDVRDPGGDRVDEVVGDGAHRHDDRDGHAALAGRAVGGGDGSVGRGIDVGVGQHDHVVLRTAERLHPLAVPRAGLIDVARDRRAADERHRVDIGMGEDRVHRFGVALDDRDDPVGEAGLGHQLGEADRGGRILLGRLQHEGVPAGDGVGQHPQRHHHREVERRDAGHDPERLQQGVHVDPGGDLGAVGSLQQVRDAAGELHALEATGHLAPRVVEHLAVLGGDDRGQVVAVGVDELAKAEQRVGPSAHRRVAPRRCRRRPRP